MGVRAFFLSMRAVRLDDETADRMLAGVIDRADAPPGYAAVTELLETARSAAGVPVPAAAVASRPGDQRPVDRAAVEAARRQPFGRRRVPVLAAVAFCAMTGGAYAAGATGAGLSTVSAVLDHIGVGSLVGASSGDPAAATSGTAALTGEAPAQTTTGAAAAAPVGAGHRTEGKSHAGDGKGHGKGHGAEISTLARTTDAEGVAKGAQISTAASGGKSHAGEHGNGGSHPAHPTHPTHPDHPAGGNGGNGGGNGHGANRNGGGSKKPGS
jgi:hypothetical protein